MMERDVALRRAGEGALAFLVKVWKKHDACAIYRRNGRTIAVATIGRDRLNLKVEAAMEEGDIASLESILRDQ